VGVVYFGVEASILSCQDTSHRGAKEILSCCDPMLEGPSRHHSILMTLYVRDKLGPGEGVD
jgi:hypothetical protein